MPQKLFCEEKKYQTVLGPNGPRNSLIFFHTESFGIHCKLLLHVVLIITFVIGFFFYIEPLQFPNFSE